MNKKVSNMPEEIETLQPEPFEYYQTVEWWMNAIRSIPTYVASVKQAIEEAETQVANAITEKDLILFHRVCPCGGFMWDEYKSPDELMYTLCPVCGNFNTWEYKGGEWIVWDDTKEEKSNA